MAYTEQSGFLRDAPPQGGSLGALVVTGITGGGGSSGPDPAEGTQGGALPTSVLWIAGADGTVLRGMAVDSTGRLRTVVEGSVAVANFPAVQPVNDNGGSLTVDAPVGAPVRVDPTGTTTQPVSGTVAVSNLPATQDVTDRDARILGRTKIHDGTNVAQVLNSAPASDTGQSGVAVRVISQLGAGAGGGGGTVAQGTAAANSGAWPVKVTDGTNAASLTAVGSGFALQTAGIAYTSTSGTITTATSTVTTGNIGVAGNLTVYLYGTYAGVNVTFEVSPDNTNWFAWPMQREQTGAVESASGVLGANALVSWTTDAPGFNFFRVRATAWTSGTANVVINPGTYPFMPVVSAVQIPLASTPTRANVASSATSTTLRAANANRKGLIIANAGTATLYVDLTGGTATTTTAFSFPLSPGATYTMDPTTFTTGLVTGIWAATGGNGANVTEFA